MLNMKKRLTKTINRLGSEMTYVTASNWHIGSVDI